MARPISELDLPRVDEGISNARLCEIFKVANMGGMRYSKTYHVLVIISNHYLKRSNPEYNPFDDEWINNVFYYTGEGSVGDQGPVPKKQNKRLYQQNYAACYLFEVFNAGEYNYIGRVDLESEPLYGSQHRKGIQPDKNGNYRRVFIFPLKLVD